MVIESKTWQKPFLHKKKTCLTDAQILVDHLKCLIKALYTIKKEK